MKAIVYRTENMLTKEFYYGVHNGNSSKYLGSGIRILKSIKKYGSKNFIRIDYNGV